tara:strand:- start:140 stop:253 length:114 start_codon:yes stop_codon:yes gene_type:complete
MVQENLELLIPAVVLEQEERVQEEEVLTQVVMVDLVL